MGFKVRKGRMRCLEKMSDPSVPNRKSKLILGRLKDNVCVGPEKISFIFLKGTDGDAVAD